MEKQPIKQVAEDIDEVKEVKKKGCGSKQQAVTSSVNTVLWPDQQIELLHS